MARFRGSSMRPVNRIKHVVDDNATVTAATSVTSIVIAAKDATALADTSGVLTGSKVNAIYLKVEVAATETDVGAVPNVYMFVMKNPGGNQPLPAPNAVGGDDSKRFVIHQEMVMMNNLAGGNPRVLFNGVVVIPKGYRRFGPNDTLLIRLRSNAVNFAYCLQCHYKEFR